jgi:DNA segregation ATPase FtsK/SpoIIIE-like protein
MTATLTTPAAVPVFPFSMFDPVHLGVDELGDQVHVNLAERNLLIGGEPGGGKSSALNLITAHGALSADCRLVLVDGNQVQLGPWRHSADMFIGPSLKDAIDAFTEFQQIMNRRYDRSSPLAAARSSAATAKTSTSSSSTSTPTTPPPSARSRSARTSPRWPAT